MKIEKLRWMTLVVIALSAIGAGAAFTESTGLPPGEAGAVARLASSPRHGEWVRVEAGGGDMVDAWLVYPQRRDRAPVVIVIHENTGLTDWARSVADQLAAEGFVAIAPDLLSGKGPAGGGTRSMDTDTARERLRDLQMPEVYRRLNAAARYATALPAATPQFGVVGFCWGGGIGFGYATEQPDLDAAVVYYGTSPAIESLARVRAPILGLYGGDDARVNATIAPAQNEMKRLGKRYETEIFAGAGHAFLRGQDGREGANLRASQQAWPRMVQFLKETLERQAALGPAAGFLAAAGSARFECVGEEAETAPAAVASSLAHSH